MLISDHVNNKEADKELKPKLKMNNQIVKSNKFHESLKYDPFSKINPYARIFIPISTMKSIVNTKSQ